MQNNITCLIFDFDGVIADTDFGRFKLLQVLLIEYGINISENFSQNNLIGLSTKAFLVKNFNNLNQIEIDEIIRKRQNLYFSNLMQYCIPYEGMRETIKYFYSKFDLAIVTTNSVENVKVQLKHLGIFDFFKWVIGREISENSNLEKTYSAITKKMHKEISECIVIEDSDFGINAARKKGYYCIRFDPENRFAKGEENERVRDYFELKHKIEKYTTR